MTDDINNAVDLTEHLPLLGPNAVSHILQRLPEDTVEAIRDQLGVGGSGRIVGIAVGAVLVGAGIGGSLGYVLARRKLATKYAKIADDEIASMRDHYQAKGRALEAEYAKRPVEDLVKERGYVSPDERTSTPPMAVQPPSEVVDEAEEDVDTPQNRQRVIDNLDEAETRVKNVFRETEAVPEWDYQTELKKRSPSIPYVIHYDERDEMEYQVVTLTYYEKDDVLCNERDEIIDPDDRNNVVGDGNLDRFGHGSNDPAVVYIRNDQMELVYEVVRSPNSYSEEVHGFSHGAWDSRNLERMRTRERDAPEE